MNLIKTCLILFIFTCIPMIFAQEAQTISNEWFEINYPEGWTYSYEKVDDYHVCDFLYGDIELTIFVYPNGNRARETSESMYNKFLEMPDINPFNKEISCQFNYLAYSFNLTDNIDGVKKYGKTILMNAGNTLFQILLHCSTASDLNNAYKMMEESFVLKYFNKEKKSGLPVEIGDRMYDVKDAFGEPTRTNAFGISYWNLGLSFAPDKKLKLSSVDVSYDKIKRKGWKGFIYGVKIGDNIDKCYKLWGQPSNVDENVKVNVYFWKINDVTLELKAWNMDKEISSGKWKKDEIYDISFYK